MSEKAQIYWNIEKQKYQLIAQGNVLATSKYRERLSNFVIYQQHPEVVSLHITEVETVSLSPREEILAREAAAIKAKQDLEVKPERPHVSSLLWVGLLDKPFELRPEDEKVAKTRGRPKKYIPPVVGVHSHKLSDEEPEFRNLLPTTINKIELDFKEYLQEGCTPKIALENICSLYRVQYAQAFNICSDIY